jgi:hypothetical protein
MSEQVSLVQEGVDRLNEAFQSIDDEFQRVQKQLTNRRKKAEKSTRKQLNRFQSELKSTPIYKRAESFRKDTTKQIESGVDSLIGLLQIASKGDLQRIDRKLTTLGRRLKEIEKASKTEIEKADKTNGADASPTL